MLLLSRRNLGSLRSFSSTQATGAQYRICTGTLFFSLLPLSVSLSPVPSLFEFTHPRRSSPSPSPSPSPSSSPSFPLPLSLSLFPSPSLPLSQPPFPVPVPPSPSPLCPCVHPPCLPLSNAASEIRRKAVNIFMSLCICMWAVCACGCVWGAMRFFAGIPSKRVASRPIG